MEEDEPMPMVQQPSFTVAQILMVEGRIRLRAGRPSRPSSPSTSSEHEFSFVIEPEQEERP